VKALENALSDASKITNVHELSFYYKDVVLTIMEKLRAAADTLETLVSAEAWPFPTYGELLFGV
jgi:glutamine synthetase